MKDSRKIKIAKKKCGSPECQRFQEVMGRLILLTPKWHSMLQRQRAKGSRHCEFKKTRSTQGRIGHSFASFKFESGVLSHGRGPFRDLVGALSGLGWGAFARFCWGAFARFCWGAFRSTQGKKKKQQARNAKQAPRALSFCLVGFAHTRRVHAVQK